MSDRVRYLRRPGGAIAYRRVGDGSPLLLLHATLSSSRQLVPLAAKLAAAHTVVSTDRRGSGESADAAPSPPRPIDVATHVDDLAALMAAERLAPALVVGHSYGGCVALELAARRPELVSAVFAYEPPYHPLAPPEVQQHMAAVARDTLAASEHDGLVAAALAFLAGVSGQAAVDALSVTARERIARAGTGAVADATLLGMDPSGLARMSCPTTIATGDVSEPHYAAIAEALVARIPGARGQHIPAAGHMAPLTQPGVIAAAVASFAAP